MPFNIVICEPLWRALPSDEHARAGEAMRALCAFADPSRSPQVDALWESARPGSYRLRMGRYRILFLLDSERRTLVFTTAFLKRRGSDYKPAILAHDASTEAQA